MTPEQRTQATAHFARKNASRRRHFNSRDTKHVTARGLRKVYAGKFGRLPAVDFNKLAHGTSAPHRTPPQGVDNDA